LNGFFLRAILEKKNNLVLFQNNLSFTYMQLAAVPYLLTIFLHYNLWELEKFRKSFLLDRKSSI